ncbi:FxSxx-COOH system tetratricopeptide repeat protein [Herpetosiphon giganteus]|uniref:FxSxx-COOH system tetratricopeptide repeat protein n=1 Tax=Herpetosiphon giganteus TaxID=2029754 RepID=UPI0019591094|nr:FxSxx-COOH system tetratricopeptide repeat protein [Herpetosiphon giganteus]MBM7846648.1 tetratricopeptide (TPR) repeat protein [Herpetosiphon giganteus]
MELPALIAVLVDAILAQCPQYDRTSVNVALESVFAGHPTLLGGNSISMLLGQHNDFRNATITIGSVHAGHTITVQLPQPIDPLPAALAALASIPLTDVPTPRSDLPQASRLPFESSPHFVGRETELNALAQAIGTAQPAVVMPAVATGLGGIGKTSLVTEFAYRYGVYFHGGVFWLNCADPDQVASQIAACTVDLGIDSTGMAFDKQVQRVLNAWKSPMPRLLIFDNCEDRAILDQWKPTVGGCRVLVTARSDHWPMLTQIRLGLLSPAESRLLLQRLCGRLSNTEADAIADDLGHLPLALHLAGSYLATYSHHTVEQYRKDLTIAHRSLKGRGALPSPTRHEQDVEATFMLSFKQLDPNDVRDAVALGMLDGAAWCAPGVSIPRDLVLAFVPDGTDADDAVDALRRLQQLGMLDGTDAVVLHRLLAQVVQTQLGSTETLAVVEDRIGADASRANETGVPKSMQPLEPHLRHATMRALDRGDAQAARLANSLGSFESLRGTYAAAQTLYERALAIYEAVFGSEHPDTATGMNNLASVLEQQGKYKDAQLVAEQALNIRQKILRSDHPSIASSFNSLGLIVLKQGQYNAAATFFEQAIQIQERVLGEDDPATNISRHNLAGVLAYLGRYTESQQLHEQVFMRQERVLGLTHPDTLNTLNSIALRQAERGMYQDAQRSHERTLDLRKGLLGDMHPQTAQSMHNLAFVLENQGHYLHAQSLYERAFTIRQTVIGLDHPDTISSLDGVAGSLLGQGCYRESQLKYEQALMARKQIFGLIHPTTALAMNNLGVVLFKQELYGQAIPLLEQALKINEQILGETHPTTISAMENLAAILFKQGRDSDGQQLYNRALAMTRRALLIDGDSHDMQLMQANPTLAKKKNQHVLQRLTRWLPRWKRRG